MDAREHGETPLIGKDIPWKTIEGVALRVKHFTPFATTEGDKVKAISMKMPYASLLVESPHLSRESYLPVVHKVDFRNLWECFQERGVNSEEEVIVGYRPFPRKRLGKLFSPFMPKLHILIYPRGHLEEAEDPNFRPDDPIAWFKPIAEWKPEHSL